MNFAIIGCGFIAKKHAKAIQETEGTKLVAICDKVPKNMDFFEQAYDAKPYVDVAEMFEKENIDVVCICTPTGLHATLAIQSAHAKKHIVLEKPMAMTLDEADQVIEACRMNQVKLSIVHPNRYRPVVQELRNIVDNQLLGKISHANAIVNWNRNQAYYDQSAWRGTKEFDGGALLNQAIHNLDLLLLFMGEVEEVYSMEATRLRNIKAEDVSNGVVRFTSGALGLVQASTTVYPQNFEESMTIFGEKGTVKIGGENAIYFKHLAIEGMTDLETSLLKQKIKDDPWGVSGHQCIIEDMVTAIRNNTLPTVTGEDGRRSLELALAFYESAEKNQPIMINRRNVYVN